MAISTLQNFYKETVAVDCTTGATNIYVSTKPTPINGYLVISPGSESLREIIKYTGTGTDGTGDYVTIALAGDRGLGGTTDQAHIAGEAVRMNYTAEHQQEIDDTIEAIVQAGAPNASTTVKGISKLSAAPADAAEPIAVGTNDTRMNAGAGVTATQAQFIAATTGMISMYAGAAAPTGFLLCDGAAVSRTTYADLFAVTSTSYGVGDGSTTFNVPDLRSSFPVGAGQKQESITVDAASIEIGSDLGDITSGHREDGWIRIDGAASGIANGVGFTPASTLNGLDSGTTYYLRDAGSTFSLFATGLDAIASKNQINVISSDFNGTSVSAIKNDAVITVAALSQNIITGTKVTISTDDTLPTGLSAGDYFVIKLTSTTIRLASSYKEAMAGHSLALVNAGAGTMTMIFQLTDRLLGDSGGEEENTLLISQMPTHTHGSNINQSGGDFDSSGSGSDNASRRDTDATGGDTPHNNMPPFVVINYIIKT